MKRMIDNKVFNTLSSDVDTLKQVSGKTSLYRHSLALGSGHPEHVFNWIDNDPTDIATIQEASQKFNSSLVQMMHNGPTTLGGASSSAVLTLRSIGYNYPNVWVDEWRITFESEGSGLEFTHTSLNDIPVFSHSVTLI